ncbi:formate dehydrogenase accessory protein FdhE [Paucidesulfovibrio longus]|uniref:formate dehydrogenase accessory protein FdhE n=1 Tax=Paucidesulfovibrio longus TaxID=889 RepID=UPI0003B4FEF5|nr:formate dehydrogenase accessory protein FdhE [Paucidesulfovibrio longus]
MSYDRPEFEKRLDATLALIRNRNLLPGSLVDFLERVTRLQLASREAANIVLPSADQLASPDEVLQGKPLLGRERFPVDEKQAAELFDQLLALTCEAEGPLAEAAQALRAELESGELSAQTLFDKVLTDDAFFAQWAEKWPEAPRTAYFLAYSALAPGIWSAAEALAENLPKAGTWNQPACPICGEMPLISTLRQKEGFRHVTCSFCRHEYRVRRLACPVCNEDDQTKLTFFTVKEEPGFRVDVCKTCKHYVKTIDFRELDRAPLPEFDDLDSMALDFVALDQGYTRATLSAWGF